MKTYLTSLLFVGILCGASEAGVQKTKVVTKGAVTTAPTPIEDAAVQEDVSSTADVVVRQAPVAVRTVRTYHTAWLPRAYYPRPPVVTYRTTVAEPSQVSVTHVVHHHVRHRRHSTTTMILN